MFAKLSASSFFFERTAKQKEAKKKPPGQHTLITQNL
jgi:hypothetical protein